MILPRFRLSLKTALIGVNLIVLGLPIAGIQILRLYESSLVRQTESSLIAQGAFVAAFYRSLVSAEGTRNFSAMSRPLAQPINPDAEGNWYPRPAVLDLADSQVLPPFPDPLPVTDINAETARLGALLNPTLKDAQLTTLAGIRLVDIDGTIIATTGDDLGLSILHGEEVAAALRGEATSRIRFREEVIEDTQLDSLSRTSRVRVFVSHPVVMHGKLIGAVLLSRTPPSIVQALYAKRGLLFISGALLLAMVVFMSLLTHRLITRPMGRLVKYAEQISEGKVDSGERLSSDTPRLKELHSLQASILEMATTLEERGTYLRDFARHVSHEFKTPLASISGAMELMQDHRHDMSDEQYQRFVQNIQADTERLQKLTDRLNELTQAEIRPLTPTPQAIYPLIETVIASGWPLDFEIEDSLKKVELDIDAEVVKAALSTLFDNAVKHGARSIHLSWHGACLRVSNDGDLVSQGNRARLFTPFFTTRRAEGGTGLGLVIARTLLARMGARLNLSAETEPTSFEIAFAT